MGKCDTILRIVRPANWAQRGGIRGILELEVLNAIERALGGELRIQSLFDLIVGTR